MIFFSRLGNFGLASFMLTFANYYSENRAKSIDFYTFAHSGSATRVAQPVRVYYKDMNKKSKIN
jgi:hypothetical protein